MENKISKQKTGTEQHRLDPNESIENIPKNNSTSLFDEEQETGIKRVKRLLQTMKKQLSEIDELLGE